MSRAAPLVVEAATYTVTETLVDGPVASISRARRESDDRAVFLKVLHTGSAREGARLRREYEIGRALSPVALRPTELTTIEGHAALVLEDFSGQPLDRLIDGPLDVGLALDVAARVATALAQMHARGIVHRDIKPQNVLFEPRTREIKLIGLGIASVVPGEHCAYGSAVIEGTPAYMSPEQTGRLDRPIDQRSDLYSAGVIFYELLTGRQPFQPHDVGEWIHCHVAQTPPKPAAVRPEIPVQVSEIVAKLLAKLPEDRYQSASGLLEDLVRCRADWRGAKDVSRFALAEHDVPEQIRVPHLLYGRERELVTLVGAYRSVSAGDSPRLVLIAGPPGIGKSVLARSIYSLVVEERGLLLTGKFEQGKHNTPYSAVSEALGGLVRHVLAQSDEGILEWRNRLRDALGSNGRILVDVAPSLKAIVGELPPVTALAAPEARACFHLLFHRLLTACGNEGHPVVLFLDDLQWADPASLTLLADLVTRSEPAHVLVVGAYRDTEIGEDHPLLALWEAAREAGKAERLVLAPLTLEDVTVLCADALRCGIEAAAPLGRAIWERTGGNPLFSTQLLVELHRAGVLAFDSVAGAWHWDQGRLAQVRVDASVADLLLGRIDGLPAATREALELGACLGTRFDARVLAIVTARSLEHVHGALLDAVRAGLLFHSEEQYQFLHDRITHAIYGRIAEARRADLHLRIGEALLPSLREADLSDALFQVVDHLERGRARIVDEAVQGRVAELNLKAALRSKRSFAYEAAMRYLATGLSMLGSEPWERSHDLAFALTLARGECELLLGRFDDVDRSVAELSRRARARSERAHVDRLAMEVHLLTNQPTSAVDVAIRSLATLGIALSRHPTESELAAVEAELATERGSGTLEMLLDRPSFLEDPEVEAAMGMLAALLPPAYLTDPNLHALVALRMVLLSLRHGVTSATALGCAALAAELVARGRPAEAREAAQVALRLAHKPSSGAYRVRTMFVVALFVTVRTEPLASAIEAARMIHRVALESGEVTWSCYAAAHIVNLLLVAGEPLGKVGVEASGLRDFVARVGFPEVAHAIAGQLAYIRVLTGEEEEEPTAGLYGHAFQRDASGHVPITMAWLFLRRLVVACHLGHVAAAAHAAESARPLLWAVRGQVVEPELHLYAALARGLGHASGEGPSPSAPEAIAREERALEPWAASCPQAFLSMHALVAAERARAGGAPIEAIRGYERAACSAHDNGLVQIEALAHDRAASLYLDLDLPTVADIHRRRSRRAYLTWGAHAKVRDLDQRYPHLAPLGDIEGVSTLTAPPQDLDLHWVLKASHAISCELVRAQVVERVLELLVEQAGASKGVFLSPHRGGFRPEAAIGGTLEAPESVVNYAAHTGQTVTVHDAALPGPFSGDAYVASARPRSMLGLPLLRHGRVVSIIYLENDALPGSFDSERLNVIDFLTAQAAISIENATLYDDLAKEVTERRHAEETLRASQGQLQAILDNMVDGVYACNEEGVITIVNPAGTCLLGYDRAEDVKRPVDDLARAMGARGSDGLPIPPDDLPLLRALGGEVVSAHEMTIHDRRTGRDVHLRTSAAPLQDEKGAIVGAVAASLNVTAAVELDRMKEQFIRAAAHELKTPVAIVKGFAEVIEARLPDVVEADRRALEGVVRGVERIDRLTSNLLIVWQLQVGKLPSVPEPVDLLQLVDRVKDRLSADAKRRVAVQPEAAMTVMADRQLLDVAIREVIDNAIRHSPGGETVEVRIERGSRGVAVISVRDRGIGIPRDKQRRVFEPFYRAHADTRYDFGGMGVGLYVAKAIVERHGGVIELESDELRGSTFRVSIPLGAHRRVASRTS